MERKKNPCVFLDVSIGDDHAGKIWFLSYGFPLSGCLVVSLWKCSGFN